MSQVSKKRRTEYLITILETEDVQLAKEKHHISQKYHKRLITHLENGYGLDDAPRSGRPKSYTARVMDDVMKVLLSDETGLLTGVVLHAKCKKAGFIEKQSDYHQFMWALKEHVRSMGHKLNTRSHGSTFFISEDDRPKRVAYCQQWLDDVGEDMQHIIFVDETTIEQYGHPKGANCGMEAWGAQTGMLNQAPGSRAACCMSDHANMAQRSVHATTQNPSSFPPASLSFACSHTMPCMHGSAC